MQPGYAARGDGEPAGMQFGIAAGQVDRVGIRVGRLVGQWRKERQFGTGTPPAIEHRRIGEDKRIIAGNRDPLSERR